MTASAEPPAAGAPPGRMPDFFIVGHPKSGTTALYEMLRSHPQIFMPDLKEPRFFAADLRARFQPQAPSGAPALILPRTLEEYLALFAAARPHQRIGEASPSYLRSRTAAAAIAEAQPAARIIAILREPADFVRSLHLELVQNHVEREQDLRRALAGEDRNGGAPARARGGMGGDADAAMHTGLSARARGETDSDADAGGAAAGEPLPRYSDRVRYVEQLRRYDAVFAPEQVLVLIYDDFRRDNEATLRTVFRFLGVDDSVGIEVVDANPTVRVRSLRLDRLVRHLQAGQGPLLGATKSVAKTLTGGRLQAVRRRLLYGAPPAADEELMSELRSRFKGEVIALGEYLDRDLVTLWGYDRVG